MEGQMFRLIATRLSTPGFRESQLFEVFGVSGDSRIFERLEVGYKMDWEPEHFEMLAPGEKHSTKGEN